MSFIDSRDEQVKNYATIVFGLAIAIIGAGMMALTSSPLMKGASLLWLPAALQLVSGVWLGAKRGFLAGGLGAYGAGIIAYGGFGIPDIIMNFIAGGFANSFLPAILFQYFKIDPSFSTDNINIKKALIRIVSLLVLTVIIAFLLKDFGNWGYFPSIILLILIPIFLDDLKINKKQFVQAFYIVIFISFISAAIGVLGTMTAGQTFQMAVIQPGIGWFLGDTVSAILGLYVLSYFTKEARSMGLTHKKIN